MSRYVKFDPHQIDLDGIERRGHVLQSTNGADLDSSPAKWPDPHMDHLVTAVFKSRRANKPVLAMLGGHPIKLGLSRYIIDLIERGLITHVATNGAGIIHDFELALVGGTSEDDKNG